LSISFKIAIATAGLSIWPIITSAAFSEPLFSISEISPGATIETVSKRPNIKLILFLAPATSGHSYQLMGDKKVQSTIWLVDQTVETVTGNEIECAGDVNFKLRAGDRLSLLLSKLSLLQSKGYPIHVSPQPAKFCFYFGSEAATAYYDKNGAMNSFRITRATSERLPYSYR
jgi:hypothetical protein